jgi:hypothetical protein
MTEIPTAQLESRLDAWEDNRLDAGGIHELVLLCHNLDEAELKRLGFRRGNAEALAATYDSGMYLHSYRVGVSVTGCGSSVFEVHAYTAAEAVRTARWQAAKECSVPLHATEVFQP